MNYYNTTPLHRGSADVVSAADVNVYPLPGSPFAHTPDKRRFLEVQRPSTVAATPSFETIMRQRAVANAQQLAAKAARSTTERLPQPQYTSEQMAAVARYSMQLGDLLRWERHEATERGIK